MRDVIVFPRKGKRPHPNEMAGSDLDGDQYWVYWGKDFKVQEPVEPLSYESSKKAETLSITYEAIIDHIINYFGESGLLGEICNLHTLLADKHREHSLSDDCKKLAEMFAIAVDAPKTGKTIKGEELTPFRRKLTGKCPFFMWKRSGPFEQSSSVTERLFLKGREKYFSLMESAQEPALPRQATIRRDLPPKEIRDESLANWLKQINDNNAPKGKAAAEKAK